VILAAAALAIERQHWDEHLEWMRRHWDPGQHIASVGPTGEGKTTYNVGLLGIRRYVLALDPKGKDETLSASGFVRVESLPPLGAIARARYRATRDGRTWEALRRAIDEGRPAKVIVGGDARNAAEDARLTRLMSDGIAFARHTRGWTLYVDEFELLSSQRMFGLGPPVERMLISARHARSSIVTSFQAAAWVSKHATRQARFAVMYPTGDRGMIKAVAESMGRDWHQLAEAVDELPRFYCLVIPRGKSGGPMMLVSAPKVG
jgi:hypothetical protein